MEYVTPFARLSVLTRSLFGFTPTIYGRYRSTLRARYGYDIWTNGCQSVGAAN
jgi:hypothetical protein